MIGNWLQAITFVTLVAFAVLGANALDRQLTACAARGGYIQAQLP